MPTKRSRSAGSLGREFDRATGAPTLGRSGKRAAVSPDAIAKAGLMLCLGKLVNEHFKRHHGVDVLASVKRFLRRARNDLVNATRRSGSGRGGKGAGRSSSGKFPGKSRRVGGR
jgi:hypothetical protein